MKLKKNKLRKYNILNEREVYIYMCVCVCVCVCVYQLN